MRCKYPSSHNYNCIACLVSHSSLSFICKYYLIFMAISSLTHDCLIYEHTGIFQLSFWLLDSSLMSLTSENTLYGFNPLKFAELHNDSAYEQCRQISSASWKKWVLYVCQVHCFIIRSGLLINFVQTVYNPNWILLSAHCRSY